MNEITSYIQGANMVLLPLVWEAVLGQALHM